MKMRALALSGMMLLAGNLAFGDDEIYAPYFACMTACEQAASSCIDNISSKAANMGEQESECANAKAGCIQQCQYLTMPPVEVVPPPRDAPPPKEEAPQQEAAPPKDEGQPAPKETAPQGSDPLNGTIKVYEFK